MKDDKKQVKVWYDNPNIISSVCIMILVIGILLAQSFAVKNNMSTNEILRNLLNHNIIYIMGLLYFIPIKLKVGKKYFNYFNLFLILIYSIFTITSFLSIIRLFGLTTLISLSINLLFLIYMIHVFMKRTRLWKEFKLEKSPFNEIKNDSYFSIIVLLSIVLLLINLIEYTNFDGVILSMVGVTYNIFLARYVFLYQMHLSQLDVNKKKISNDMFLEIDRIDMDFPKLKSVKDEVSSKRLNGYQVLSLVIFGICFIIGIFFGNLFPSCASSSFLYDNSCNSTEFNFSLTICIWFVGFLISVFFYGIGNIITLLESINHNLEKKK